MKKKKVKPSKEYTFIDSEIYESGNELRVTHVYRKKEKELTKTWEEYCTLKEVVVGYQPEFHIPVYLRKAFGALGQLIELRDHYNDGWVPDWKNGKQTKHVIYFMNGNVLRDKYSLFSAALSFKDETIRNEFLSNFALLIHEAKPLL